MISKKYSGEITEEIKDLLLLADPDENMLMKYLPDTKKFMKTESAV